ncbi:hypothetical protein JDV02_007304 [Purpureocillium takamizusanense]|uniref:Serum paraoxonase/arylesterase family protein n=1 Tax=Purpureocillium takamizusanense TaxID=2060973 RepID=A0A9Q8VD54_9HYPO|nr:uncharacterized protein JDV02_007304 [Purpureocillium takamizusanense]UNI21303.1 hypothetical protein JDV02_007304 [Purpureocillium takamizusanense]
MPTANNRRSFLTAPYLVSLLLVALVAYLVGPTAHQTAVVFGFFRRPGRTVLAAGRTLSLIEQTTHCEDLHHHQASGLLFTACENDATVRHRWFPPLTILDSPEVLTNATRGTLKVIDPKSLAVQALRLEGFDGPFVTHGIDVIDDPQRAPGEAVYIFAVNHVPNRDHFVKGNSSAPKSRSVVEIFHHVLGSDSAQHLRSVWDALIDTPNDVYALSPTSFFVTNDHYYKEGPMRSLEDLSRAAKWSSTIYVEFSLAVEEDDKPKSKPGDDDTQGVQAWVALDNLHNNNGLGHGRKPDEIAVVSCCSGAMHLGRVVNGSSSRSPRTTTTPQGIELFETIQFDSIIDNPSYFSDPFATDEANDSSGFVLCGLTRAVDMPRTIRDPEGTEPIMVWKASPDDSTTTNNKSGWKKQLLFEDDGSRVRSASSAVLVAADPAKHKGAPRRARLFVTGFLSKNIAAVDVDL